jgi:hypothetical protein
MFPRLQRIDGHVRMPVVHRGHHHGIDIFSFEQFSVVAKSIAVLQPQELLRRLQPLLVNIAHGGLDDVVRLRVVFLVPDVRHSLAAHADVGDGNPIVGADDAAG